MTTKFVLAETFFFSFQTRKKHWLQRYWCYIFGLLPFMMPFGEIPNRPWCLVLAISTKRQHVILWMVPVVQQSTECPQRCQPSLVWDQACSGTPQKEVRRRKTIARAGKAAKKGSRGMENGLPSVSEIILFVKNSYSNRYKRIISGLFYPGSRLPSIPIGIGFHQNEILGGFELKQAKDREEKERIRLKFEEGSIAFYLAFPKF